MKKLLVLGQVQAGTTADSRLARRLDEHHPQQGYLSAHVLAPIGEYTRCLVVRSRQLSLRDVPRPVDRRARPSRGARSPTAHPERTH